jgi:hypothetical protein
MGIAYGIEAMGNRNDGVLRKFAFQNPDHHLFGVASAALVASLREHTGLRHTQ